MLTSHDVKAIYGDKAENAVISQLSAAIDDAEVLLDAGILENIHQAYVLLDNFLSKAKTALESGTAEDKLVVLADLNGKIQDCTSAAEIGVNWAKDLQVIGMRTTVRWKTLLRAELLQPKFQETAPMLLCPTD